MEPQQVQWGAPTCHSFKKRQKIWYSKTSGCSCSLVNQLIKQELFPVAGNGNRACIVNVEDKKVGLVYCYDFLLVFPSDILKDHLRAVCWYFHSEHFHFCKNACWRWHWMRFNRKHLPFLTAACLSRPCVLHCSAFWRLLLILTSRRTWDPCRSYRGYSGIGTSWSSRLYSIFMPAGILCWLL